MARDDRPPGFFVYILDLVADGKVEVMTTEEFGAYMLLLFKSWFEDPPGSIPDDDYTLSRWTRLAPDRWTACKTRALAPFRLGTDSRWHQKRLRKEFEQMRSRKRQQAEAATIAANARWGRGDARRMRDACETQSERNAKSCLSSSFSSSISTEKTPLPPTGGDAGIDPTHDGLFETFYRAYPRHENPEKARAEFLKAGITAEVLPKLLAWIKQAKLSDQWQDKSKIPHPSTWLHQKRWKGDPPPPPKKKTSPEITVGAAPVDRVYERTEPQCRICEDTGRVIAAYRQNNGRRVTIASAPWKKELLGIFGKGNQGAEIIYRCSCAAGTKHQQHPELPAELAE